ncbi:MAG: NHL repeat-containing protein [Spirochaetia bacterium]|nr:NHL repeat-containing protein [Spirochaetia bacterium]
MKFIFKNKVFFILLVSTMFLFFSCKDSKDDSGSFNDITNPEAVTAKEPIAVIENVPPNYTVSNSTTIAISGEDIVAYKYKLNDSGWSDEIPVSETINFSSLQWGWQSLSVIGKNNNGDWQKANMPTNYKWLVVKAIITEEPGEIMLVNFISVSVPVDFYEVADNDFFSAFKYNINNTGWSSEIAAGEIVQLTGLPEGINTLFVVAQDRDGFWQLEENATVYTWFVQTETPAAVLSNLPVQNDTNTSANITVGGSGIVSYSYRLDTGSWSPETSVNTPISLSSLSDGNHIIQVIGKDTLGNWQDVNVSTVYSWNVVYSVSPTAVISNLPDSITANTTANITVGGTGIVAYKYSLDGGTWSAETDISTVLSLSSLIEGSHTINVIGKNSIGTWQETASSTNYTWVIISTTLPSAVLLNLPDSLTVDNTALITVSGSGVVAYKYSLDGGAWSSETDVSIPINLSGLSDGIHTISVIGKNSIDAWQETASSTDYTWEVNTSRPTAVLSNLPSTVSVSDTASISVSGSGVVAYKYSLDGGAWSSETDVSIFITLSGLSNGSHTISVIGKSSWAWQETASATSYTWEVNTTQPVAVLSNLPPAIDTTGSANITVGGTDVVSYQFSIDGSAYSAETNISTPITLTALGDGLHVLSVIGKNSLGVWQDTGSATQYIWTKASASTAVFTSVPGSVENTGSAVLTVGGTGVISYQYSLNGGSWSSETDISVSISLSGLSDGSNTVFVIGKNSYGIWQDIGSAASYSWTVDTTPPVFGGITYAKSISKYEVELGWAEASDTITTDSSFLVYDVFISTTSGVFDFSKPARTSPAGAVSISVDSLTHETMYYFVVRARDTAGNRDTNIIEKEQSTMNYTPDQPCAGVYINSVCKPSSPYHVPGPSNIAKLSNSEFVVSAKHQKQLWFFNADTGKALRVKTLRYRPTALGTNSNDEVYVGNSRNKRIDIFNKYGIFLRSFGEGLINKANDIEISESLNKIFITDGIHDEINSTGCLPFNVYNVKVFDLNGNYINNFDNRLDYNENGILGEIGINWDCTMHEYLNYPVGIKVNNSTSNIVIADNNNRFTHLYDNSGVYIRSMAKNITPDCGMMCEGDSYWDRPMGIDVDSNGLIYVADGFYGEVNVFDATLTSLVGTYGSHTGLGGTLEQPTDVMVYGNGKIYVTNSGRNRIEVFNQ